MYIISEIFLTARSLNFKSPSSMDISPNLFRVIVLSIQFVFFMTLSKLSIDLDHLSTIVYTNPAWIWNSADLIVGLNRLINIPL